MLHQRSQSPFTHRCKGCLQAPTARAPTTSVPLSACVGPRPDTALRTTHRCRPQLPSEHAHGTHKAAKLKAAPPRGFAYGLALVEVTANRAVSGRLCAAHDFMRRRPTNATVISVKVPTAPLRHRARTAQSTDDVLTAPARHHTGMPPPARARNSSQEHVRSLPIPPWPTPRTSMVRTASPETTTSRPHVRALRSPPAALIHGIACGTGSCLACARRPLYLRQRLPVLHSPWHTPRSAWPELDARAPLACAPPLPPMPFVDPDVELSRRWYRAAPRPR